MERRTAMVTALSVAGVLVTGAAALGANLRILGSADSGGVGQLTASASAPASTGSPGAPIGGDGATLVREVTAGGTRSFLVQDAGTVYLGTSAGGLRLDAVVPDDGWRWTADQPDTGTVTVTFASASPAATTYRFSATLGADGTIAVSLDQPADPATAAAPSGTPYRDHDGEREHDGRDDDD